MKKSLNIVFIIPTGIGADIGGHAGDATPAAKLIATCCDNLIIHPNVTNASDLNEMSENMWYVEGSILNRFLKGAINLNRPYKNKILLAVNKPVEEETINCASAARATIGADISILELDEPLEMIATMEDGKASGIVRGWESLVQQVSTYTFDALALATPITVEKEVAIKYMHEGGVNPWGGVEAIASKLIAFQLDKPTAHAPVGHTLANWKEIADPRMAAETVSVCYLHCVLKGLHRAPRIEPKGGKGLSYEDIDCLISPWGCWGEPHEACYNRGIAVIAVRENKTCLNENMDKAIAVENYLEAAGLIMSWKAGVSLDTLRRPLAYTNVLRG